MKYSETTAVNVFPYPLVTEGFSFLSLMGYDSRCFQFNCVAERTEDFLLCSGFGIEFPSVLQAKSLASSWEVRGFLESFDFHIVLDTYYVNFVHAGSEPHETRNRLYEALFKAPYSLEVYKKKSSIPDEAIEASIATSIKMLLAKAI